MKLRFYSMLLIVVSILVVNQNSFASDEIPAYYQFAKTYDSMNNAIEAVKTNLAGKNFKVIGEYIPGGNSNLYSIAYTREDLQNNVLQKDDRGFLAAILKIGLQKTSNGIIVSMINPMYLFNAYLLDDMQKLESKLIVINNDINSALTVLGNKSPFGGSVEKDELQEYHYMFGMPYFTDPVELKEFDSFEEGVKTIKANLNKQIGQTVKVYELIREDKKTAVFGIGLLNPDNGESHFLPIIGEQHVAAMPYEIILQKNTATMLNGRYRIALHWPELTMGTFTQIMSTPGDIEETFELLVE